MSVKMPHIYCSISVIHYYIILLINQPFKIVILLKSTKFLTNPLLVLFFIIISLITFLFAFSCSMDQPFRSLTMSMSEILHDVCCVRVCFSANPFGILFNILSKLCFMLNSVIIVYRHLTFCAKSNAVSSSESVSSFFHCK